jgi:hypothetical protein
LFSLAIHKDASIKDLVVVVGNSITWNLAWRRSLFLWEEERVNQLLAYIVDFRPSSIEDSWRWNLDPEGSFSFIFSVLIIWSRCVRKPIRRTLI